MYRKEVFEAADVDKKGELALPDFQWAMLQVMAADSGFSLGEAFRLGRFWGEGFGDISEVEDEDVGELRW